MARRLLRCLAALLSIVGLAVNSFLFGLRLGQNLPPDVVGGVSTKDHRGSSRGSSASPVPVCVRGRRGPDPRQSIWAALNRFGSGRYRFVVPALEGEECDPGWLAVLSLTDASIADIRRSSRSGDRVVLTYHKDDDKCKQRNWTQLYRGVRPDFSAYWDGRNPISMWNSTRSPDGGGGVAFLPLGPQFAFRPVDGAEVVPPSERRYPFNFVGTPQKSRARKWRFELLANMTADIEMRKGQSSSNEPLTNSTWPDVFLEIESLIARETSGYVSAEAHRMALLQSVFTLCPSDNNPESHRIYEAAEAGSIPVVALDKEYLNHKCRDALLPFIESGAPFVYLNDWSELDFTLAELLAEPERLANRQAELRRWYRDFMGGVGATVERVLDARIRGLPVDVSRFTNMPRGVDLPIVVVGLNKAGTSSIRDYFRCGGAKTSHFYCGEENHTLKHCANVIKENIKNGRPPLSGEMMEWDVFSEINNHHICYFPQVESLFEIHEQYPNATFILNLRNAAQWASSVKNWGYGNSALPKKLVKCDLPGLPPGVGSKEEELVSWFEMHSKRVREFVSQHPSHKLVEVSIDSEETGRTMEEKFGIGADCWGFSNVGKAARNVMRNHTCHPPNVFTKIPQTREKHTVKWGKVCAPNVFPTEKIPAFLLIGAQKAGTTVFFRQCTQHPLIRKPPWKEFHMLAGRNMLDPGADVDTWKRNYRFMFGNATGDCPSCITGEATPQYIKFPNTIIPKLQSISPWVKIVVMLRNPIARALSAFNMRVRLWGKKKGNQSSFFEHIVQKDFAKMRDAGLLQNWTEDEGWVDFDAFAGSVEEENALRKLEERELEIGFSGRGSVITSGLIFRGMYELQLRQWIRAFGADNVLVINTDKERVGPEVCSRFHELLGLDPSEIAGSPAENNHSLVDAEKRKEEADPEEGDSAEEDILSLEMATRLKRFYSPYNRRLGKLLGEKWTGDVWGYT